MFLKNEKEKSVGVLVDKVGPQLIKRNVKQYSETYPETISCSGDIFSAFELKRPHDRWMLSDTL